MFISKQLLVRANITYICITLLLLLFFPREGATIGCYVCTSINGSDPLCEDTFDGHHSLYKDQCMNGRKGRDGMFPAVSCIKFKAWNDTYTVLVRDCSVDNGDITSDTEMGRESHCWMVNMVNFDDVIMAGCSLSCRTDGCNIGSTLSYKQQTSILLSTLALYLYLLS